MSKKQDKISRSTSTYWQYLKKECKDGKMTKRNTERMFRQFVSNRSNGIKRVRIDDIG